MTNQNCQNKLEEKYCKWSFVSSMIKSKVHPPVWGIMPLSVLTSDITTVRWEGWGYSWWLPCSSTISWCVSPWEQLDNSAIKGLIMFCKLCITYSHVAQHQMEPIADTLLSSCVLEGPLHIFCTFSLFKPATGISVLFLWAKEVWRVNSLRCRNTSAVSA